MTVVWRKASYSGTERGNCVELASLVSVVGVRDSKAPDAGHLSLTREGFADLVAQVRRGELGL
jgi:hypothetical protein